MLIFAIDEEPKQLQNLHQAIAAAEPLAAVRDFQQGLSALAAVSREGLRPDVVFSEIRMSDLNGLELAAQLRALSPATRIIFVTSSDQYALEAYQLHVSGYLRKPAEAARIREELDALQLPYLPQQKLKVQCFGYFEVFWQDKPLHFQRQQTKELLAYLISREGAACTNEQISTALWENEGNLSVTMPRIRVLLSDLRATLRKIGMEDVLIRKRGWAAVDQTRIDCDFYRLQAGDRAVLNTFHGQFMQQYSWAEWAAGELDLRLMASLYQ